MRPAKGYCFGLSGLSTGDYLERRASCYTSSFVLKAWRRAISCWDASEGNSITVVIGACKFLSENHGATWEVHGVTRNAYKVSFGALPLLELQIDYDYDYAPLFIPEHCPSISVEISLGRCRHHKRPREGAVHILVHHTSYLNKLPEDSYIQPLSPIRRKTSMILREYSNCTHTHASARLFTFYVTKIKTPIEVAMNSRKSGGEI